MGGGKPPFGEMKQTIAEDDTMRDLGAKAFSYGYASPVLMAATYNDGGTVNVMNLHEVARTNAGDLACCIGKPKKTHANIEKRALLQSVERGRADSL